MGCEECSQHLLTVFNPRFPRSKTGRGAQQVCSYPGLSAKHLVWSSSWPSEEYQGDVFLLPSLQPPNPLH